MFNPGAIKEFTPQNTQNYDLVADNVWPAPDNGLECARADHSAGYVEWNASR